MRRQRRAAVCLVILEKLLEVRVIREVLLVYYRRPWVLVDASLCVVRDYLWSV